ncbi:MAG TPA: SDR family NAD(P)-dependent oxidoreductase [Bacteriovoracaceae bacterium]|nr:SDR family NAD(P)-dependent oxidoreductase [Bacteriovoracaceae bacterium]
MKILFTGATGFIGQRLARRLASDGHEVLALTRSESLAKAEALFKSTPGITLIEGDISDSDVLASSSTVTTYIDQFDCVVHLAALYDLQASHAEAYCMNVVGTQNLINLMKKMKNLRHFHYFSTYAVNPLPRGLIKEDDLVDEVGASLDNYTKTKNTAEFLVRKQFSATVQTIIHRPGVIIGDSQTGKMDKLDGPYYFFNFIQKLKVLGPVLEWIKFLPLPTSAKSTSPILPVNVLVDWSATIINGPKAGVLKCYHLVPSKAVSTKDFLESSMVLLKCPLRIINVKYAFVFSFLFKLLRMPREMIFFMSQEVTLDRSNLDTDYPGLEEPNFQDYLPRIIEEFLDTHRRD